MDSILDSIKKLLGIESEDTSFDTDVIIHVNSAFMTLNQLGVGPTPAFSIVDSTATWDQFLGEAVNLDGVKSYIYLKLRMIFDPPSSAFVLDAMTRQATEMEWRLNVQAEEGLYNIPEVVEEEEV